MALSPTPYLTLVVPAYKQKKTITRHLLKLDKVLKDMGLPYEIICVVDGMMDRTYAKAKKISSPHIRVFSYEVNRGKGHAVRFGLARAKGQVTGFIDANGIKPQSVQMIYQHHLWYNSDIIIGSKRHPVSKVKYPLQRRIVSWFYQKFVKLLFGLDVKDTQVGLKLFKREVLAKVLPRLLIKEFAFDIEILAVANYLGFKKIYEAPVELELSAQKEISSIYSQGFWRTVLMMLKDSLAVFYRLRILHYYDDSNSDNWRRSPDLEFWQPK